jgi:Bacteriophage replication gene A protein (GPA)
MLPLATRSEHFQRNTWSWRLPKFEAFPPSIRELCRRRLEEIDRVDYREANTTALELSETLHEAHVGRAFDEQELRDCAQNYAQRCEGLRGADPLEVMRRLSGIRTPYLHECAGPVTWLPVRSPSYAAELRAFAAKCAFAETVGVKVIPASRTMRFFGLSARMNDPLWWRRQLRMLWSRKSEHAMRQLGVVRNGREVYVSESAVRQRGDQRRRMKKFFESSVAVNELGESLELADLVEASLSNPRIRRGELMARARGFEEIADRFKHRAVFLTLTCPSVYHAELHHGGRNPRYAGATVRQAQEWLCRTWARCRSQLQREDIRFYGVRVAEPHHDGTPHWHVLLFSQASRIDRLADVIRSQFLKEFGAEAGAYDRRVHVEQIDRRKGSAVGYLAKYIAKNLDAAGAIHAKHGRETGVSPGGGLEISLAVADGIARVDAWAALHRIRQFQQLGGPPVGLYREARRLRQSVPDLDVERARANADRGDWRGFCLSAGYRWTSDGTDRELSALWRKERRARAERGVRRQRRPTTAIRLVHADTGRRNRFGELCGSNPVGLCWGAASFVSSDSLLTRPHRWRIERKGLDHGTVHKNSVPRHGGMEAAPMPFSSPVTLGPVAVTVRPEKEASDLAESWFHRTEALIRQLACQYRLSETPDRKRKWGFAPGSHQIARTYVRMRSTGPPH